MCPYCYQYRCPPQCPAYRGESAEHGKRIAFCRRCGKPIYERDRYYRDGDGVFCFGCLPDTGYILIRKYE